MAISRHQCLTSEFFGPDILEPSRRNSEMSSSLEQNMCGLEKKKNCAPKSHKKGTLAIVASS